MLALDFIVGAFYSSFIHNKDVSMCCPGSTTAQPSGGGRRSAIAHEPKAVAKKCLWRYFFLVGPQTCSH
jgi:hypothetical protein